MIPDASLGFGFWGSRRYTLIDVHRSAMSQPCNECQSAVSDYLMIPGAVLGFGFWGFLASVSAYASICPVSLCLNRAMSASQLLPNLDDFS